MTFRGERAANLLRALLASLRPKSYIQHLSVTGALQVTCAHYDANATVTIFEVSCRLVLSASYKAEGSLLMPWSLRENFNVV
jgi:hypothetical protein